MTQKNYRAHEEKIDHTPIEDIIASGKPDPVYEEIQEAPAAHQIKHPRKAAIVSKRIEADPEHTEVDATPPLHIIRQGNKTIQEHAEKRASIQSNKGKTAAEIVDMLKAAQNQNKNEGQSM